MGRTLTRVTLASTSDFSPHKNDKIKGWVEHNGGTFSKEIDVNVTHLVASSRAWKSYAPMVKEARRLRTIRIVRLEWLEDSLMSKSRRPLDTKKYEYEHRKMPKKRKPRNQPQQGDKQTRDSSDESGAILPGVASRKDKMRKLKTKKNGSLEMERFSESKKLEISAKEFDAVCMEFEKDMGVANYRPFVDREGVVYLLTLVRKDKLRERLEKHRVKVRYAPYFTSEQETSYEISHQNPHPRRTSSGPDIQLGCDTAIPSIEDQHPPRSGVKIEVESMKPRLPLCPVPLYYFPKPYPYSAYPVVASALPSSLSMSNRRLRVRVPNPWAQGLQLFEYNPPNDGSGDRDASPKRTKEYACYTIYSRPGHRHVETLAPPGSTFDFAWNMFQKMFKQKVGVEWEARVNNPTQQRQEEDGESRTEGEDEDDDDRLWECFGPLRLKQQSQVSGIEEGRMDGKMEREPSVTLLVNTPTVDRDTIIGVQAKTPQDGW